MSLRLLLFAALLVVLVVLLFSFTTRKATNTAAAKKEAEPEPVVVDPKDLKPAPATAPQSFAKSKRVVPVPQLISSNVYIDALSGAESIDGTFSLLKRYFDHVEYLETADTLSEEQIQSLADISSFLMLVRIHQTIVWHQHSYKANLGAPKTQERLALLDEYMAANQRRLMRTRPPKEPLPVDPRFEGEYADLFEDRQPTPIVSVAPEQPQLREDDADSLHSFIIRFFNLMVKQEFETVTREHIDYLKPLSKDEREKLIPETVNQLKKEFGTGGMKLFHTLILYQRDWFYIDDEWVILYSSDCKPFTHARFSRPYEGKWKFVSLEKGIPDLEKARKRTGNRFK